MSDGGMYMMGLAVPLVGKLSVECGATILELFSLCQQGKHVLSSTCRRYIPNLHVYIRRGEAMLKLFCCISFVNMIAFP